MKHGTRRNRRTERTVGRTDLALADGTTIPMITAAHSATVEEVWCNHCQQWSTVRGVTGALRFMAEHDDGSCSAHHGGHGH